MSDELLQAMWDAYKHPQGHLASMRAVLDVLHAHGYRRCAEGQRTTQWCGRLADMSRPILERAEKAEAEVERLRARDEQWRQKASAWMASPEAAQRLDGYRELAQRLNAAEGEVERLRAALTEAIEEAECWARYAPEYFLKKHDYEGSIAKLRAAIDAARGES
jgi:hypothetical protein